MALRLSSFGRNLLRASSVMTSTFQHTLPVTLKQSTAFTPLVSTYATAAKSIMSLETVYTPRPKEMRNHRDPISDALNRIRQAYLSRHASVLLPSTPAIQCILKLLQEDGYIRGFETIRTHIDHPVNWQHGQPKNDRVKSLLEERKSDLLPIHAAPSRVYFNVLLKYHQGKPLISQVVRVSKPGWVVQMYSSDIPAIGAPGCYYILKTEQGDIMTDKYCRLNRLNLLVEVLFRIM
eukprot:TRINITY_DN1462_c0_g1::TRINITY_DN1462_c0_g1_i1::g.27242::m.27242 TRINITY_DN1462_c0_g1::TRINITY_DN1462_c0_g1_i1::g.27242  ORF type:complete len:248 (+),score=12.93,sp/A1KRI7/RS8_NEIMF/33.33/4e-15,Ribosomal_S8/PF00410.14/5e-20 TRINITY_DN1462_c0_g1_i1:40-744(+)